MDRRQALRAKWHELGPLLRRKFWNPLRNMMEIFHVLPLAAAVILFVLLAIDGQFREIYIAYLEGPKGNAAGWLAGLVAAAAVLALISAVLSEAHFSLSTMRINVVYSSYSNPDANSSLRRLQRTAAFVLAFLPWLGVAVGLFGARNFVADRYCQLLNVAQVPSDVLQGMQHLLRPGGWTIAGAVIFLGIAAAAFSCVEQKTRIAQRAVALIAPPLAVLLFLLFTDRLIPSISDWRSVFFCAVTLVATVVYFIVYQWLYRRRSGPVFSRARSRIAGDSTVEPEVDLPKNRGRLLAAWALAPLWVLVARPEFSTGISLQRQRRRLLVVWALLPWFLLVLYFALVPYFAPTGRPPGTWPGCPIADAFLPVPGQWAIFPAAMCWTIGIGLLVGLVLNRLSEQWMWRRIVIVALVVALAVGARTVAMLDVHAIVSTYRLVGPLATAGLQLLFLIAAFALLAWLSQRSGFPALTLVILAIVVCAMFPSYAAWAAVVLIIVCVIVAGVAFLSGLRAVGAVALLLPLLGIIQYCGSRPEMVMQNPANTAVGAVDTEDVKFKFECWLGQRGIAVDDPAAADQLKLKCPQGASQPGSPAARPGGGQKYPVFIIAAEGGGIYAASAASMFLARLQDQSPHFAEHVFAISGVSGGAIGSTIFQALDKAAAAPSTPAASGEKLAKKVVAVMEDDHFSPVVGSIFAEILGATKGRAEALVASFEDSVAARDSAAGKMLSGPFARHWAYNVPALVLNATWVETGFRVAFAPFHLHDIDESLYSFSDELMPDENCPTKPQVQTCVSLMQAAAVSARFPLVLPPFSTAMTDGKRWNFVDGAYTDNSGATTALDLYRTLRNAAQNVAPDAVDLKIILVTSSIPQPDLKSKQISGTVFRDTIAPIDALMKVRENLGNDAVARACSEVYPQTAIPQTTTANADPASKNGPAEAYETCIGHAGDPTAALQIVEIQDQTYGLSLGWKISQTSFDVVSWMLGKPSECAAQPASPAGTSGSSQNGTMLQQSGNRQLTRAIVQRNSCVLKAIEDLLNG